MYASCSCIEGGRVDSFRGGGDIAGFGKARGVKPDACMPQCRFGVVIMIAAGFGVRLGRRAGALGARTLDGVGTTGAVTTRSPSDFPAILL